MAVLKVVAVLSTMFGELKVIFNAFPVSSQHQGGKTPFMNNAVRIHQRLAIESRTSAVASQRFQRRRDLQGQFQRVCGATSTLVMHYAIEKQRQHDI